MITPKHGTTAMGSYKSHRKSRMSKLLIKLICVQVVVWSYPAIAMANNQSFVIGFGYSLAEAGQSEIAREYDLEIFFGFHFFADYYAFGAIGVGVRSIRLEASMGKNVTVAVDYEFITIPWIVLGSEDYARFGLLGGFGRATYKLDTSGFTDTASGRAPVTITDTASGRATLFGGFVDWGGEFFGGRFGANRIEAELGKVNGFNLNFPRNSTRFEADASGIEYYYSLRWAF